MGDLTLRATLVALVSMGALTTASSVLAVEQWQPTELEMMLLPPYCKVRFDSSNISPEYKEWQRRLGPDFLHVHHFCAGLNFLTRSYRPQSKADRDYNLHNAELNFTYTIKAVRPTFSLLPDAYLNRGVVRSLGKDAVQAVPDLVKALELNPRLVRGYVALAGIYGKGGKKSDALAIVTDGLRHNPESKLLQTKYTQLGGRLPYPEPAKGAQTAIERTGSSVGGGAAESEHPDTGADRGAPSSDSVSNDQGLAGGPKRN